MAVALPYIAVAAAVGGTAVSVANYEAQQDAAGAAKEAEAARAETLRQEQAARDAGAAQAATTGSTFGFPTGDRHNSPIATGFGFAGAPTASANAPTSRSEFMTGLG